MGESPTAHRRQRAARGRALAVLRRVERAEAAVGVKTPAQRKKLLVSFCRIVEQHLKGKSLLDSPHPDEPSGNGNGNSATPEVDSMLTPRMRQTLARLLAGDAEKQIATHLKLSRHTVHEHVKKIYRRFAVNSRGELLARFVNGKKSH